MKRPRLDVNLEELDRVLDQAREAPLSEPDYDKLKSALHALAGMLAKPASTEDQERFGAAGNTLG
jgi:hypothetical protein